MSCEACSAVQHGAVKGSSVRELWRSVAQLHVYLYVHHRYCRSKPQAWEAAYLLQKQIKKSHCPGCAVSCGKSCWNFPSVLFRYYRAIWFIFCCQKNIPINFHAQPWCSNHISIHLSPLHNQTRQLPAHPCQPLTLKASSTACAEDTATSLSDFSCAPSPQFMITFKWSLDTLEKDFTHLQRRGIWNRFWALWNGSQWSTSQLVIQQLRCW